MGSAELEPSLWFCKMVFYYNLQKGGYPFSRRDLKVNEWQDLGLLKVEVESVHL